MSKENEDGMNQLEADNDFAERFYKLIVNTIICLILLVILTVFLFWGDPDLHDAAIGALNNQCVGENCP